jgi:hypothetical protein
MYGLLVQRSCSAYGMLSRNVRSMTQYVSSSHTVLTNSYFLCKHTQRQSYARDVLGCGRLALRSLRRTWSLLTLLRRLRRPDCWLGRNWLCCRCRRRCRRGCVCFGHSGGRQNALWRMFGDKAMPATKLHFVSLTIWHIG